MGFEHDEILKVLRMLYLRLNARDNKDLETLIDVLKGYGFLLFLDEN